MIGAISILPGHGNRPDGWDSGAVSPAGWSEAELVRDVAAACWRELQRRQVASEIVSAGSYAQRGQDAEAGAGSRLVVQLHADASTLEVGPDLGHVFFWPGNDRGRAAAIAAAMALEQVLPWTVTALGATESWPGPRACLAAVRPASILVEPGFTDGRLGRVQLPLCAAAMGEALAHALAQV